MKANICQQSFTPEIKLLPPSHTVSLLRPDFPLPHTTALPTSPFLIQAQLRDLSEKWPVVTVGMV